MQAFNQNFDKENFEICSHSVPPRGGHKGGCLSAFLTGSRLEEEENRDREVASVADTCQIGYVYGLLHH